MKAPYPLDPLAWRIRPGLTVGDLQTVEACDEAALFLDMQRADMMAQIGRVEAGTVKRPAGWRNRIQGALSWTSRIKRVVLARGVTLRAQSNQWERRRKAMLAVIYDEVGEDEFARFAKLTEAKHPQLFQGGEHV